MRFDINHQTINSTESVTLLDLAGLEEWAYQKSGTETLGCDPGPGTLLLYPTVELWSGTLG